MEGYSCEIIIVDPEGRRFPGRRAIFRAGVSRRRHCARETRKENVALVTPMAVRCFLRAIFPQSGSSSTSGSVGSAGVFESTFRQGTGEETLGMKKLWALLLLAAWIPLLTACPSSCECSPPGKIVQCTRLGSEKFPPGISHLVLYNVPPSTPLVLTRSIVKELGLTNIESLKIVNSSVQELDSDAFVDMQELWSLNLTQIHLLLLKPDMFVNNTKLEKLTLRMNDLSNMQASGSPFSQYFLNIPSLQELDLYGSNLKHILPTMFTKLSDLEYVNLASNNIKSIPKGTFSNLESLTELNLENNMLAELDPYTFTVNTLSILRLSNNPLTTVKGVNISVLEELHLASCKFGEIEQDTFSSFTDLSHLNLSNNAISKIHENSFSTLEDLRFLDLSYNALKGPLNKNTFAQNTALEKLVLRNNPAMKSLPEGGFSGNFPQLYELDLSYCGIEQMHPGSLKALTSLSSLNLAGNSLSVLEPDVITPNIIKLDLSHNHITQLDISFFPEGSNLANLFLTGNPLKHLTPAHFSNIKNLRVLDVSSCQLTSLWEGNSVSYVPQALTTVHTLYLSNNKIENITKSDLEFMKKLKFLDFSKNPITCKSIFPLAEWLYTQLISPITPHKIVPSADIPSSKEVDVASKGNVWFSSMLDACGDGSKHAKDYNHEADGIENEEDPEIYDDEDDEDEEEEDDDDEDDEDDEEVDEDADDYDSRNELNVVNRKGTILHQGNDQITEHSYLWNMLIILLSVSSILLVISIIIIYLLRWYKGSYLHLTRKGPRFHSSMYQQLFEHQNLSTTPILPHKSSGPIVFQGKTREMREQYNSGIYQPTTTYIPKVFKNTKNLPEPV